jgi:hypothetical protein
MERGQRPNAIAAARRAEAARRRTPTALAGRRREIILKLGLTEGAAQRLRAPVTHQRRKPVSIPFDRLLARWAERPKRVGHGGLP